MRINKIVKSVMVLSLLLILVVSMVGCGEKIPNYFPDGELDNQCRNDRYYFQQGYSNDWTANFKEDEYALDPKNLLLFEMWPTEAEGKAIYSIYTGDTHLMTTNVLETTDKMLEPTSPLYFNKRFIKDETPREGFAFTSDKQKAIYNNIHYQRVKYSYTVNGENWVGEFYVTMKGSKYYVITWERKADVADTYQEQFLTHIIDYRFRGLEDEKK